MPGDSITTLLRLNSEQIRQQQWKWAYYDGYCYVTLPNNGASAYEGVAWLNGSSSDDNKKNFFVYRNAIYVRYQDSTWPATTSGYAGDSTFAGLTGVTLTHNIGDTNYHVSICPTAEPGGAERADFKFWVVKANNTAVVYCSDGVTNTFSYRIMRF
jgi:hypothetical protein